jgi:hypothetical protein
MSYFYATRAFMVLMPLLFFSHLHHHWDIFNVLCFHLRSLEDSFDSLLRNMEKEKPITLDIVRSHFMMTAMEQLEELSDSEWEGSFRVNFIGEEGLDSGGLRREFFTLLFELSDLLEHGSFRVDTVKLFKKHYLLLGKTTAVALIHGHPGPQCFNEAVTNFITKCMEPDNAEDICVERDDIKSAIHFVSI